MEGVRHLIAGVGWTKRPRKVDARLPGTGNSNSHGARPVHFDHLDDQVDSDQQVINKELSLSTKRRWRCRSSPGPRPSA